MEVQSADALVKKTVVAPSTCEAEDISLSTACREAVWLKGRLRILIPETKLGLVQCSDRHSATRLPGNEGVDCGNKTTDLTYHYVHDAVARKEIT